MKKIIALISCLTIVVVLYAQDIPARPNPPKLVNDYVGLLTPDQRDSLEKKLVAYDDTTSNQIAIVIMESIGNADPGDYASELGRKWGVGGKEFNNGVVILITTGGGSGNRHVFISPGYGLEKAIPDITAKEIVDYELIPRLREGNYYRGLNNAANGIIRAAAGEYKAPAGYGDRGPKIPGRSILPAFIAIFVIIWLISRRGGGKGGGGFMSRRGYRSSAPPIWWFPTGGGGGGFGGGGGGGGGGFGGFGGGSFGGGGAGGNW
ncbi:MAG: TPM domain-containing protein [Chitinophagaceae bacterium]